MIQVDVNNAKDIGVLALGASTKNFTDLLGVGGKAANLAIGLGELDVDESALSRFQNLGHLFGVGRWCSPLR